MPDPVRPEGPGTNAAAFLDALLKNTSDVIYVLDSSARVLYVGPSAHRVLGYSPGELLGTDGYGFVHPDDVGYVRKALEGAIQDPGNVLPIRYRFRHKNGEWRILQTAGHAPVDGPDMRGIVVNARDVTEEQRALEELEKSHQHLRALLERAADVVALLEPGGTIRFGSPSVERLLGWEPEQFVGRNLLDFVHPEDAEVVRAVTERLLRPGELLPYDFRFLHRDETWRMLTGVGRNLLDDPAVLGLVVNLHDVTERRALEQEQQQREEQLREAQEIAHLGSWTFDLVRGELRWSEQLFRMTGLDPREGITMETFLSRVHPDDREFVSRTIENSIMGDGSFNVEHRILGAGDRVRIVQARATLVTAPDGRPLRYAGTLQDVTERKLAEAELVRTRDSAEAANRAKSDFLSRMSHELRTPLNSVIGFANVLRKDREGNLSGRDVSYLERILANGKHLLGLINDILDLSKVEAGKMELEIEPVALDDLVLETLRELQGAVREKEVDLLAEVPEEVRPVHADRTRLKQVLTNLVGNAIKFTEAGAVTVSVAVDPESRRPLRIDVRDTGIGIPPDRLAAIFQPFEQAESGTARQHGGTGLGLAISRSLSELMGFRLEVDSEPGKGSTFAVVLAPEQPAGRVPSTTAALRAVEARAGGDTHAAEESVDLDAAFADKLVLVIDDDTDARILLTHHLEELGCRTIVASSGEQGVRMAREFGPDLITLDLLLPGQSGWEVLRALKVDPVLCEIPVVVITGVSGDRRGNVLGAVDLLEKPIERESLLRVIRRNLAGGKRRVLIVDDEPDAHALLRAYLEEEGGIEIRSASSCKRALRVLESFEPDVIVLDVMTPDLEGIGLVLRLQRMKKFRQVPVVLVTARDLSTKQIRDIKEQVQAVLRKDAPLEQDLRAVVEQIWERGQQEDFAASNSGA